MNDEKDESAKRVEKPALVEEMGLLDGQEIVKSPSLRSLVEGVRRIGDD
ncbi:hypothetical protein [Halorussus ruber]|nr:hypothetical protein [Halorussus ruber]